MVEQNTVAQIRSVLGNKPRRVLVTGGTGFIGSHLSRALAEAGHEITCTGRNRYRTRRIYHDKIRIVIADVRDRKAIAQLCDGQDLVYHVGALSTPWAKLSSLREVNVEGTGNIVEGCLNHQVKRLIHVSSTAIFFDFRDKLDVTDDAPLPARYCCPYATSKAEAEEVVQQGVRQGLNAIIIRARAVFGPGDNSLLPRLRRAAKLGRLRQVGSGKNVVDLTYIDNLVYALALAAEHGNVGSACTITNEEPVKLWNVVPNILGHLRMPMPKRSLPYWLAMIASRLLEFKHTIRPKLGEPAITRYGVGLMAKSQTFDGATARQELGYRPLVCVKEGLQATLHALQAKDDSSSQTSVRVRLFSTGLTRARKHHVQRGAEKVMIPFHAVFAVIEHPTQGITLFDTGYAPRFYNATNRFPYSVYKRVTPVETDEELSAVMTLRRLGILPQQVQRIIISHFHADHVCGLHDFPEAELISSESAWKAVRGKRGFAALQRGFLPDLLPADFADRLQTIEHFHDPGMGPFEHAHDIFGDSSIRLFELPGHAVGQIGAIVQTGEEERKFLVADAAWTTEAIEGCIMPHSITRAFLASFKELRITLGRLHEFHQKYPGIEIIPTHCPEVAKRYEFPVPSRSNYSSPHELKG